MAGFDYTYLSLGAGLQSTAMMICSTLGLYDTPRADVAIFADTGDEPKWVYDQLETLRAWSDIPIEVAQKGHLSADLLGKTHFVCIPAFSASDTGKGSMLRRQCTREYKIAPIEKKVRELLGYQPRQRVKERAQALIGISIDEVGRMRPSRTKWVTNSYPLVNAGLNRFSCLRICRDAGFAEPKKSACVYCPYHDNAYWRDLKANHADEFQKAVTFDVQIRNMTMKGDAEPAYIHRSLKPLSEVNFDGDAGQMEMFDNDCEGMCGV